MFLSQISIVFGNLFRSVNFPLLTEWSYILFLFEILKSMKRTCSATATAFAVAVIATSIFPFLQLFKSILS